MHRRVLSVLTVVATMLPVFFTCAQAQVEFTEYWGTCDASAAVGIGPNLFVVANDEDNVLRVYKDDEPGYPVQTFDLTTFLKPDMKHPETDIEAATWLQGRVYWITSHGTNKKGKHRASRHRLFATEVKVTDGMVAITGIGIPYENLVKDLSEAPQLEKYHLGEGAKKRPKEMGGLNIEGLCATPQGTLLISFRNPIPGGKALLVPLENPNAILDGEAAKFGNPILLSLGGLGVRSIEYVEAEETYFIIAGPYEAEGVCELYQWSGHPSEEPEPIHGVDYDGWRPEALAICPGEHGRYLILGDDGSREIDGQDCKNADPDKRSFRGLWITP